ncbi:MAG TPA: TlpA disulfide reductase family protein [Caulobacteraceae bacterium]|jgi:thiol-disulfide isomerase/thioredoxin
MRIGRRALVAGAASACIAADKRAAPRVGEPSPPFDVFTFEFKKIHFAELRGKVVLLNFWASWCGPCKLELPRLDAYYRRHAAEPFRIFAVRAEDGAPNQAFNQLSKALSFPLVWKLDAGAGYAPIDGALPTNFVIDASGVLRYAAKGAFTSYGLEQVISPLLKEAVAKSTMQTA